MVLGGALMKRTEASLTYRIFFERLSYEGGVEVEF